MKKYWKEILIIVLVLISFWIGCNHGVKSVTVVPKSDTSIKVRVDTFYRDTIYPVKTIPGKTFKTQDTLFLKGDEVPVYIPYEIPQEVADMLTDYDRRKIIKDSSYKGIIIVDTLHRNNITGRSLFVSISDTTITNTKIIYPPRKSVLIFNIDFLGNKNQYYGVGTGFTFKTPKDNLYSAKIKYINNIGLIYEAGIGIPIRLKKSKN